MKDDKLPDIGQVTTEIIDGLRIRLSRSGRSDGLPVLLTSPWPESIYAFHRVLPYFVEAHPVIAIDLPGFGLSESRPDVMSPSAMGAFLIKVAAHLNLRRLHGVGPDVGAFAAIDGAEAVFAYLTNAAQITPPAVIDDFRRASAGRRFEDAADYVRAYNEDLPLLEQRLARVQTSVLVIAGKNDPIVPPANNQFLADRLPRNRLSLLEAAHRAWEEATESYSSEIMSWIGGASRVSDSKHPVPDQ